MESAIVQQVADSIFSRGRWATTPREITDTFASFGHPNPSFDERSAVFHALVTEYETRSRRDRAEVSR